MLSVFLIIVWGFTFLVFKYFMNGKKYDGTKKTLDDIRGPTGLPFVGNISLGDDAKTWKQMRATALQYYPIYKLKIFNMNIVCILDPKDIESVVTCKNKTRKGKMYRMWKENVGHGLVVQEGKVWHIRRKLLTKSFHFNILMNYLNIFNKQANSVVNQLQGELSRPIDVLTYFSTMTLNVIQEAIIGENLKMEESSVAEYREAVNTATFLIGKLATKPLTSFWFNFSGMKKQSDKARKVISNFSSNILTTKIEMNEKISENSVTMLDILMTHPDVFDNTSIIEEINTFVFAGHDTTSTAITYVFLALANYPQHQVEVLKEIIDLVGENELPTYSQLQSMNFLDRFIKECLRMFPPISFIARELTEEFILKSGYVLDPGTIVMMNLYDISTNPNNFPEPEKFDPDRFLPENIQDRHPFAYVPFGAGSRNCIAQKFAILQIKNLVCRLLQKFQLEPGTLIKDLAFIPDLNLRNKNKVQVQFVLR